MPQQMGMAALYLLHPANGTSREALHRESNPGGCPIPGLLWFSPQQPSLADMGEGKTQTVLTGPCAPDNCCQKSLPDTNLALALGFCLFRLL